MFKKTRLARGLLVAFGGTAALYGGSAFAQDQPAGQELERVTVTGSNIRRTDTETPSPVQVITEAEIKKSGYTTISEVLQTLTANGQGTLSNAFPGAFAGSATGISLRGLNTSATLVLIDGHRMAPFPLSDDGQRSFVDISSIPFDAVERIEVLKDGASAVYGSDAMAGVVNIILKRNYKGTSITADGGTTGKGGGTTAHASVISGTGDLDTDGYNAYVNIEYRHQDPIFQRQRQGAGAWSNLNQTAIGGINQTPGVISSHVAAPPAYGTVYLQGPGTFSAATTDFYTSPIVPNAAYNGACASFDLLSAGSCAFTNPYAEVQPKTENVNIITSLTKKLGDSWTLALKASLFNSKGEQFSAGSTANGLVTYPTSFQPLVAESAGVAPHLVGTAIPSVTVPANYPGNTLGVAARIRGVSLDAPVSSYSFDSNTYRLGADINGSIGDWTVAGALGLSTVITKKGQFGATDVPALYAALNRTSDPWLITGGNTAADIAAVYPAAYATSRSDLQYAELSGTRNLMPLQGGDLALNIGGESIHRRLDSPAPDLVAQGIISGNNAYVKGSQTDNALYAELVAPVLKTLELDGHIRYDRIDSLTSTTPSAGFKFNPIPQLAIRGTYGKGFRAPNPAESGQAGQGYSAGTGADPILCPNGDPTTKGNVIAACNYNVVYNNSSNPNLAAEKSTSETLGLIFEPIKGWSSTLDFYQVEIKNQIVAGTGDPANAVRGAPALSDCSDGKGGSVSCTPSVGPILYIPVEFVNANQTKVSGWELDTRYKFSLGEWGSLTPELDWSHTMSYVFTTGGVSYQLAGTHGPAVIGGNTGNPKDRAQLTLTYERGPLQVAGTMNYISSFSLTDPSGSNAGVPVLTCEDGVNFGGYFAAWVPSGLPTDLSTCSVHSFTTFNFTAVYKLTKNWTLRGAIDNAFDRQPPLDLNTYGGGNLPYNPSMHQAGAVGRFFSAGATYTF